ncbi:MAG TPA: hypothetical protein VNI01_04835, partial [Elusimicrobiota bacterium]|nr:hypothetical protein [Elusimicrobiota bacterium]
MAGKPRAAMEAPYVPPSVLHLSGLQIRSYTPPERLNERRLLARAREPARRREPVTVTERVPATFTGLETWPASTSLLCWECGFAIEGRPCFVPTYVRDGGDGRIEMGVDNLECSFPCAARRIAVRLAGDFARLARARDLLQILFFLFSGRELHLPIQAAPERTRLRQFGGDLDESEFRAKIRELDPLAAAERRGAPAVAAPLREGRALQMVAPPAQLRLETKGGSMWSVCEAAASGAAPAGETKGSASGAAPGPDEAGPPA